MNYRETEDGGQRAKEGLEVSERKYRELADSLPQTVAEIDIEGNITFTNANSLITFGYIKEDFDHGMNIFQIIAPEDHERAKKNIQKFLKGQTYNGGEYTGMRKDGSRFPFTVYMTRVLHQNKPVGFRAIVIDITERKKAEEELRQKTALLEAQVNASLDGIIVVDGGKKILQNQRVKDLFKIPRHIVENDDNEKLIEWVRGLAKNPEEFYERVTYILAHPSETTRGELELKDGTVLDRYSRAIVGKDGKQHGRMVTFRDITERKRAEQKIMESEQSLQAILTASPIGIGRVKNRVIEWVNESMCRISGYAFEELEGKSARLLHESDEAFEAVGKSLYTTGQADHRLVRKDGTMRDVFVQISTTGSYSFTFTVTDITQQKQTERDLRKSELLYRTLMETSSEIIMLLNANRKRIYVSPNITNILGYSVEEFLAANRADFTHPDSVFAVESARSWSLKHPGKPVSFEARNRHKDGSWRWFEATSRNMLEEPNVNAMVMSLHDITKRKRAEDELLNKSKALEELNTALKVLIDHYKNDQRELEERILSNIRVRIIPRLEQLKQTRLDMGQSALIEIIESSFRDISSPFSKLISSEHFRFTPKEIEIICLIREGKTTKEIAQICALGKRTIDSYRDNIRNKLKLTNKKANLRTYLLSMNNT